MDSSWDLLQLSRRKMVVTLASVLPGKMKRNVRLGNFINHIS